MTWWVGQACGKKLQFKLGSRVLSLIKKESKIESENLSRGLAWDTIVVVDDNVDGPFWIVHLSKYRENKIIVFWRRLKLGF